MGGPASWFVVTSPNTSRAFAIPRSCGSTSMGMSVLVVTSENTSAAPSRNIVTSTIATFTDPVTIASDNSASTPARTRSTQTTTTRRSSRSAISPACSPTRSHGSRCRSAAAATSVGECVWEAMSSGPAASEMPSPTLLIHAAVRRYRNPLPKRAGQIASPIRLTRSILADRSGARSARARRVGAHEVSHCPRALIGDRSTVTGARLSCEYLSDTLTVLCDGNVTCGLDDPNGIRSFGNIKHSSVDAIWRDLRYAERKQRLAAGRSCDACSLHHVVEGAMPERGGAAAG